jgi:plasmid segregation protein ParM
MSKIVRALDVGYGNVKFVTSHDSITTAPVLGKFPSRAIVSHDSDIAGGLMSRRKTVTVEVNGKRYEVGPDVAVVQSTHAEATSLDKAFCKSDEYMARVIGALSYMQDGLPGDKSTIDLLVCGLPVSTYQQYRQELARLMTREFKLPNGSSITVKRCTVLPQPLGAYFNYIYGEGNNPDENYEKFKKQTNLIIDPGFFTFDWLLSKGMMAVENRSGAVFRGMSSIIDTMAKAIAKSEKTDVSTVFKILDDAIREGVNPRLFGKEIDMANYYKLGQNIVGEAINAMVSSVGDGADIDNIMVAGGGADFYIDAIRKQFPRHTVLTSEQPVFANVIGFQYGGMRMAISEEIAARRDSQSAKV